jgi:hypothetical protein
VPKIAETGRDPLIVDCATNQSSAFAPKFNVRRSKVLVPKSTFDGKQAPLDLNQGGIRIWRNHIIEWQHGPQEIRSRV